MGNFRVVGIDVIKGITIFMMIIVHAVTQVIADYDGRVFLDLITKIPKICLYCLVYPLVIMGLWGTIFTFVTGITTAISAIRICNNNKRAFPSYLLQRFIFLVLLRLVESVGDAFFDKEYDIFNNGQFVIPPIKIGGGATTLDSIGWAGIIAPIVIYMLHPLIKKKSITQVIVIFSALTYTLFFISPYTIRFFAWLSKGRYRNEMGLLGDIFGKVAFGRFKIAQTGAFAVIGALYGVLIHYAVSISSMIYLGLGYLIVGIFYLIFCAYQDPNVFNHFVDDDVPLCAQVFSMGGITFLAFIHCYFVDGNRPLEKKLKSRRHVTFVLRLSMITLTIFCTGSWVGRQIALPFKLAFGPPCVHGRTPMIVWNFWVCLVFTITLIMFWWGVSLLWEVYDFKYSLEYLLMKCLSVFTGKPVVTNSRKFVYGPAEEIKEEMENQSLIEEIVVDSVKVNENNNL